MPKNYKEYDKGPKYDLNGDIIDYSIVGSVEHFKKRQGEIENKDKKKEKTKFSLWNMVESEKKSYVPPPKKVTDNTCTFLKRTDHLKTSGFGISPKMM